MRYTLHHRSRLTSLPIRADDAQTIRSLRSPTPTPKMRWPLTVKFRRQLRIGWFTSDPFVRAPWPANP